MFVALPLICHALILSPWIWTISSILKWFLTAPCRAYVEPIYAPGCEKTRNAGCENDRGKRRKRKKKEKEKKGPAAAPATSRIFCYIKEPHLVRAYSIVLIFHRCNGLHVLISQTSPLAPPSAAEPPLRLLLGTVSPCGEEKGWKE